MRLLERSDKAEADDDEAYLHVLRMCRLVESLKITATAPSKYSGLKLQDLDFMTNLRALSISGFPVKPAQFVEAFPSLTRVRLHSSARTSFALKDLTTIVDAYPFLTELLLDLPIPCQKSGLVICRRLCYLVKLQFGRVREVSVSVKKDTLFFSVHHGVRNASCWQIFLG